VSAAAPRELVEEGRLDGHRDREPQSRVQVLAALRSRFETTARDHVTGAKRAKANDPRIVRATANLDGDGGVGRIGPEPALHVLDEGCGVEASGSRFDVDDGTQGPGAFCGESARRRENHETEPGQRERGRQAPHRYPHDREKARRGRA
jgi:hypothetical protein